MDVALSLKSSGRSNEVDYLPTLATVRVRIRFVTAVAAKDGELHPL